MREIEFRGKRINNSEWVYGHFFEDYEQKKSYIYTQKSKAIYRHNNKYEVIPETVGQYIGQKDKVDTKIFEGHIIKGHYFIEILGDNMGVEEGEEEKIFLCMWNDYLGEFVFRHQSNNENDVIQKTYHDFSDEGIEILGDIYTTPELIKEPIKV